MKVNFKALNAAPVVQEPFPFCCVQNFVRPGDLPEIRRQLPSLRKGGSYPLFLWQTKGGLRMLVEQLTSASMKDQISSKFRVDYSNCPSLVTLRGFSRPKDGRVHTDSLSKIVTVLLYLSPLREHGGGDLRLLACKDDAWDKGRAIPSGDGTLLIFPNSRHSWHGYPSFTGERYVLQMNYMVDYQSTMRAYFRHTLSAFLKNW